VAVLPVYASAVPASEAGPRVSARRAAVGRRMRELRKQAGLTQEAAAEAAGLTRQFYLAVEAGQRTLSLDNVFAIADALGADPRDLFTELPAPGQARPSTESAK
jgi:transcriptional regulator with XRE-family HTH domain